LDTAISSASITSSARRWAAIDHPTIRRLNRSSIAVRCSQPSPVEIEVMSATQTRSGASVRNHLRTRSGAGPSSPGPLRQRLRRMCTPCSLAWRISLATRLRVTRMPSARSSAVILGAP
jgi:hypothetical protein